MRELLVELRRLESEATPSRWVYAYEYSCLVTMNAGVHSYEKGTKGSPSGYHEHEIDLDSGISNDDKCQANGQLIAALRNASPVLIEALETLISAASTASNDHDLQCEDTNGNLGNLTVALLKLDTLAREVGK